MAKFVKDLWFRVGATSLAIALNIAIVCGSNLLDFLEPSLLRVQNMAIVSHVFFSAAMMTLDTAQVRAALNPTIRIKIIWLLVLAIFAVSMPLYALCLTPYFNT